MHPVSPAELIAGSRNRTERAALVELIDQFERVQRRSSDFDHCLAYVRRLTLSHGVGWPDCLIAASAIRPGAPIITLNDRQFKVFRGLKARRPY